MSRKKKLSRKKFEKAGWTFEVETENYSNTKSLYFKSPRMNSRMYCYPTYTEDELLKYEYDMFCASVLDDAANEMYDILKENIAMYHKPLTV